MFVGLLLPLYLEQTHKQTLWWAASSSSSSSSSAAVTHRDVSFSLTPFLSHSGSTLTEKTSASVGVGML